MTAHLFLYPNAQPPQNSSFASIQILDPTPDRAREQIKSVTDNASPDDILVFWDTRLGEIPFRLLETFETSLDDVWHPGNLYPPDDVDFLKYVVATSVYREGISPLIRGAINFRINLRSAFIRARIMQVLGGLESGFATLEGAALEMGWRWHQHGGICRQQPDMLTKTPTDFKKPLREGKYRLIALHHGSKWLNIVALRRILAGNNPMHEWRASRKRKVAGLPAVPVGAAHRDLDAVSLPDQPTVSVVLPTYGRYQYVAEVLEDLRQQTIRPTQILIADGNPEGYREPEVYEKFPDLPLEVLWLEPHQNGTCASRNACLSRVTGEYVWFVDDDSRFDERNLENHLRVLLAYGADVSVGPAYTKQRPELHSYQREIRCTFMDCGTTLCKTAIIEKVGGFDMQYNQYLAGEDGDIGDRFVIAGGLMLNNPHAKRFHYLAPVGGARSSSNNIHRWKRWSLSPRPVQSIYYRSRRYFNPRTALAVTLNAWLLAGRRRKEGQRATLRWKIETLVGEALALPVSLIRLWRSITIARRMLEEGPQIPPVKRQDSPHG